MKRHLLPERNASIVERFSKGVSIRDLAEQHHLEPPMIYLILRRAGVRVSKPRPEFIGPRRPPGHPRGGKHSMSLDIQHRNAIIFDRYLKGDTATAIGNDEHITRERVRQILAKILGRSRPAREPDSRVPVRVKQYDLCREDPLGPCACCGEPVFLTYAGMYRRRYNPPRKRRLVCKACHPAWRFVCQYVSEDSRNRFRKNQSAWYLRNLDRPCVIVRDKDRLQAIVDANGELPGGSMSVQIRGPVPGSKAWHALWKVRPDLAKAFDEKRGISVLTTTEKASLTL